MLYLKITNDATVKNNTWVQKVLHDDASTITMIGKSQNHCSKLLLFMFFDT